MKHHHIIIFTLLGAIIIVLILITSNFYSEAINAKTPTQLGVSYSPTYAKELGLDPKQTYQSILNDLEIKNLRLNAYWDEIEPQKDQYNFGELDYYIDKATEAKAKVILTVGFKLPRWPECRAPRWIETTDKQSQQDQQLEYVAQVIQRYNQNPTIIYFQIENEPLFAFGICPPPDLEFLQKEVGFVRTLTKKPIMLTDSGEFTSWIEPMKLSDIFGTTLYRVVETPFLGDTKYPLQPWFYRVKSNLIRKFFAPGNQRTIIAELQTEAWSDKSLAQTPIQEQLDQFPISHLEETLLYAKRIGFDEIYLWGVEWWYYLTSQGHPEYLEFAKIVF
jgi:hypothetical protein